MMQTMNIARCRILLILCCLLLSERGFCQFKWFNPVREKEAVVQNQGFISEIGHSFSRLPLRAQSVVSEHVWALSQDAAGLAVHFKTDAAEVKIRYAVSNAISMEHMPSTGVSGIDLYQKDRQGKLLYCFGGYPSTSDTICYDYSHLSKLGDNKEYQLYLPLYNSLKWLEIGVPEGNTLFFIPASKEAPIVVYGTSIVQGGCASRPAMAWTNILCRHLDVPVINMGFSSNGRLDKNLISFINELNPRLVVLDCLPNLTDKGDEELSQLIKASVAQIRAKERNVPILLVEHAGYNNAATNDAQKELYERLNKASFLAYKQLKTNGDVHLFYLSNKELGFVSDCFVDEVHYNDCGMEKYAAAIEKKILQIFKHKLSTR
jgi:hypothetical protein